MPGIEGLPVTVLVVTEHFLKEFVRVGTTTIPTPAAKKYFSH